MRRADAGTSDSRARPVTSLLGQDASCVDLDVRTTNKLDVRSAHNGAIGGPYFGAVTGCQPWRPTARRSGARADVPICQSPAGVLPAPAEISSAVSSRAGRIREWNSSIETRCAAAETLIAAIVPHGGRLSGAATERRPSSSSSSTSAQPWSRTCARTARSSSGSVIVCSVKRSSGVSAEELARARRRAARRAARGPSRWRAPAAAPRRRARSS